LGYPWFGSLVGYVLAHASHQRRRASDQKVGYQQRQNTEGLKKFLANEDKFIRSKKEPKPGDIFLWRNGKGGHTGIVVSYDPKTGIVVTAEARGTDYGTQKEVKRKLRVFTSMAGWEGFFRPKNESGDENESPWPDSFWDILNGKWPRIDDDSKDGDEFFLGPVNLDELAKRREERAIAINILNFWADKYIIWLNSSEGRRATWEWNQLHNNKYEKSTQNGF
jgi:hypothetical protein